jgi:hypothetical protein
MHKDIVKVKVVLYQVMLTNKRKSQGIGGLLVEGSEGCDSISKGRGNGNKFVSIIEVVLLLKDSKDCGKVSITLSGRSKASSSDVTSSSGISLQCVHFCIKLRTPRIRIWLRRIRA